jgi:hypothetical protein
MAISGGRAVTVLLTEEHMRKIIEQHLLKEDEISDPVKLSRVVQKSLDTALGFRTCMARLGRMGEGAYVTGDSAGSSSTGNRIFSRSGFMRSGSHAFPGPRGRYRSDAGD